MVNVEIYIWNTCPFCFRAKQLLDRKGISYIEYNIEQDAQARDTMIARGISDQQKMPQIFINNQYVGDSDKLYQLDKAGKLDQ